MLHFRGDQSPLVHALDPCLGPPFNNSEFRDYFNDNNKEKLCFIQFSTRMAGWLLLTFLIYLHIN